MDLRYIVTLIVIGLLAQVLIIKGQSQNEEEKVRVVQKSINIRETSFGVEVLGEVINETSFIIGFVRVNITFKDSAGKVLDTGSTSVNGKTVEVNGFSTDSGIFPGETASFSRSFSEVVLDGVNVTNLTVTYDVAGPRTDISETPILIRISRIDSTVQQHSNEIRAINEKLEDLSNGGGATSGLPGDLDNDGDVDFSDFLVLARNYGKTI